MTKFMVLACVLLVAYGAEALSSSDIKATIATDLKKIEKVVKNVFEKVGEDFADTLKGIVDAAIECLGKASTVITEEVEKRGEVARELVANMTSNSLAVHNAVKWRILGALTKVTTGVSEFIDSVSANVDATSCTMGTTTFYADSYIIVEDSIACLDNQTKKAGEYRQEIITLTTDVVTNITNIGNEFATCYDNYTESKDAKEGVACVKNAIVEAKSVINDIIPELKEVIEARITQIKELPDTLCNCFSESEIESFKDDAERVVLDAELCVANLKEAASNTTIVAGFKCNVQAISNSTVETSSESTSSY